MIIRRTTAGFAIVLTNEEARCFASNTPLHVAIENKMYQLDKPDSLTLSQAVAAIRDAASDDIMYATDKTDLEEIATVLENGDVKMAARLADGLDTVVREGIPSDVWELLRPHV